MAKERTLQQNEWTKRYDGCVKNISQSLR